MKLTPNKHFNIQKSVLVKTTIIIQIMLSEPYIKFDELYRKYHANNSENDYKTFILALDLLFVLGKIRYFKNNDTIGMIINED
uniref:ABC-three component system middle component 6 n=1 Tax=Paenibacillus sp. FSL K6-0276 TaxID=2921450 RepID=UPI00403F2338